MSKSQVNESVRIFIATNGTFYLIPTILELVLLLHGRLKRDKYPLIQRIEQTHNKILASVPATPDRGIDWGLVRHVESLVDVFLKPQTVLNDPTTTAYPYTEEYHTVILETLEDLLETFLSSKQSCRLLWTEKDYIRDWWLTLRKVNGR